MWSLEAPGQDAVSYMFGDIVIGKVWMILCVSLLYLITQHIDQLRINTYCKCVVSFAMYTKYN